MIFTTILITCFFALAGVMQAPMADTFLLSLTVLSLPSLSAISNIFTISSPMLVPSLPMPAVLEPFGDLLMQVSIPFTLPSKTLGPAPSSPSHSPTPRDRARVVKYPKVSTVILIFLSVPLAVAALVFLTITPSAPKSALAFVSCMKEHLLRLLDDSFALQPIIITDYEGLTHSLGFTHLLDDSSLPTHDDIDSTDSSVSGPPAASVSLDDIFSAPVTFESFCMPFEDSDSAPFIQEIDEDDLARDPSWTIFATGPEEVESFETDDWLLFDIAHEVEEWADPFRDDG